MAIRAPMAIGEWYHCYNRGFDKIQTFKSKRDYQRFLVAMYLCNGEQRMHMRESVAWDLKDILQDSSIDRGEPLVDVGAYALMPNHVHFVLKEKRQGGIALYMQKVFTSYTMYFNKKYERTGSLFAGTFKSKHIPDDRYLKRVIPYVLLNPDKSFETPFSNLADFLGEQRPENKIVADLGYLYDEKPTLVRLREEAALFDLG